MIRSRYDQIRGIFFINVVTLLLFAFNTPLIAQKVRIGVISDLHYSHPSLIVERGKALDDYLNGDRKMILESDAILKQAVQYLLSENPDIVLIPGDLTKDGELASHLGVAELLSPLREKGIKVLVVPGNHDINNPNAVSFRGDTVSKEATISADDFAAIYKDYGYGRAVSRDEHSLSYVSEPVNGLRVLCIDACRYYDNRFIAKGDEDDYCITHGAIKPETMAWLRTEMQVAQLLGKQVLVMIHHNVVEHFAHQGYFAAPYMVDNFKDVQKKFIEYGINILFTGHFHSSDISMVESPDGNILYEVETGSVVTYPCPYRIVEKNGDSLHIETKHIEGINYPLPDGTDFKSHALMSVERGLREVLTGFVNEYHHSFAGYLPGWTRSFITIPDATALTGMIMSNLSEPGIEMILAHYCGNEDQLEDAAEKEEEMLNGLNDFISAFAKESAGRLAGITERFIQRSQVVRNAKETISSIWNDNVEGQNGERQNYKYGKADDLQLTIKLKPATEGLTKEYSPCSSSDNIFKNKKR
ncbi:MULTISPECIES: metallophosphoesterase family protein [Proteiniphilum]|jgi:predicted MPP superfamily phosphohydrolase|uniref:metallophosphoesterase family protein n=1 Tax=Proteiniphilum TaxID=294702 RepID=UPI001EEB4A6B|nr:MULTISPECIES: metallophosphoesterase [Proteiniphilum]ULB33322.1 metallophosphoesterase [Proteiniphilum propionicum]